MHNGGGAVDVANTSGDFALSDEQVADLAEQFDTVRVWLLSLSFKGRLIAIISASNFSRRSGGAFWFLVTLKRCLV